MKTVFIHGTGGWAGIWHYQTDHLPGSTAVTLPGHPEGAPCRTIRDAARWLKQVADREGWRDMVLVGHSLGGGIALQYALDYPEDLSGIVPIGSGARLRVLPETLSFMADMVRQPEKFPATLDDAWPKADPAFREVLRAKAVELGPAPFLNDLEACDQFDVMDRLTEITTPTHAIVGTEDVMTPPLYSEYLRDHMPAADVTIIEGGSHFVFVDEPERVNQAIDRFLGQLRAQSHAAPDRPDATPCA